MRLLAAIGALCALSMPVHALPRVVSLDYCADQYVLKLAAREQIAGVTAEAGRDYSAQREAAGGIRTVRPDAESILALRPDLVVRSWPGDGRLDAALERFGVEIHTLGDASDFDGVRAMIQAAAAAMDRTERGEAIVADMDAALAEAGAGPSLGALYVTPGGVTAGAGVMLDAMIEAAGLTNHAAGASGWAPMPLEQLVAETPDLILAGFFDTATERVDQWSAGRHPVMRDRLEAIPSLDLDAAHLSCAAWHMADEALAIRRAVDALIADGRIEP